MISQNPTTIQLRYLQTLSEIGVNQNTTVVFPLPMDLVKPLLDAHTAASEQAALPRGNGTACAADRRQGPDTRRELRFVGPGLTGRQR